MNGEEELTAPRAVDSTHAEQEQQEQAHQQQEEGRLADLSSLV